MQTKLLVVLYLFAASLDIFVSSQACEDLTVSYGRPWSDSFGDGCSRYEPNNCNIFGDSYENFGLVANEACCVCGGGTTSLTISPRPTASPARNNDNDSTDSSTTVIAVLGSVVAMSIVVVCLTCAQSPSQNSNNNVARSTNLRTRPTQHNPQQAQPAASIVADERNVRRGFILTNIIHKVCL